MKLIIQLPITGVQFSNRFAHLDESENNQLGIMKAMQMLKCIDDTYHMKQEVTPPSTDNSMLILENAQLKKSQEYSQEFMNVFKYKNPELFSEIATLVDEVANDIAANATVDDKILENAS